MVHGIRRAAVAGLLIVFGPGLAQAEDGICLQSTRPDPWWVEMVRIDQAGQREEVVALLTKVGRIPTDKRIRPGRCEPAASEGAPSRVVVEVAPPQRHAGSLKALRESGGAAAH